MNKLIVLGLVLSSLSQSGFSQERPYAISYQDRGPVISHATCRLVLHPEDYGRVEEEKAITNFLTLKGYRPFFSKREPFEKGLFKDDNTAYGDLVLTLKSNYLNRNQTKFTLEGELGYIGSDFYSSRSITPLPIKEVSPISSRKAKYSGFLDSSPLTYKIVEKRITKALVQVASQLPDCIHLDSGHHYELEKYNENIVIHEFRTCHTLYTQEISRIEIKKANPLLGTASFLGYGSVLGGLISGGALLPVGVGLLGVSYGVKIPANIRKKKVEQGRELIRNLHNCYVHIQEGKSCSEKDLLKGLNTTSQKRVKKYLEHVSPEELTQKVADYLGTEKSCSEDSKRIHKVTLKKLLKEVRKTL